MDEEREKIIDDIDRRTSKRRLSYLFLNAKNSYQLIQDLKWCKDHNVKVYHERAYILIWQVMGMVIQFSKERYQLDEIFKMLISDIDLISIKSR
jgi:hypothetical protein